MSRPTRLVLTPDGAHEVEMTDEDMAELEQARAGARGLIAARDAHRAALDAAMPGAAVLAKVRAGQQLTAPEQAGLVRWLVLQAAGPEAAP